MTKKTISITLSSKSIENAIKELEKYKNSLEYKTRLLAETLAERGVEIARVKVADFDAILSGELIGSIHDEYVESIPCGAIFAVVCDSKHAVFVEFGTGERGKEFPAEHLPEGLVWDYNIGSTIKVAEHDINFKNGTVIKAGEHYWFYPGKDGKWHITKGMPSRPFMYETWAELYKIVPSVATEIFGKE